MIRYLTVVAMIHYLWLMFGSSVLAGTDPSNTDGQLDSCGGIASAGDASALKAAPAAGPYNGGNSGSVNVPVDSGASGDYFDDALIPGLWYKLANYQVQRAKSPPPGGTNSTGLRGDCSVATSSMATECST